VSTRRFKLNTHLTMPLELLAAPGANYHRGEPGGIVEIDAERCKAYDRFIRGRIRAGDITELECEPAVPAPQPAPTSAPVKE
jgi:hypothetical protein